MTDYTAFLPRVMASASGVPREIALDAIGTAIIRLCTDSQIWQHNNTDINVVQSIDSYNVTPAGLNARVVSPVYVKYNKIEIPARTREWLNQHDSGWDHADEGVPTGFLVDTVGSILLNRKPEENITAGLVTRVSLRPTRAATSVDDDGTIYEEWQEAVEHGALEHLLSMTGRAWTDMARATDEGKTFVFEIQRARARAKKGQTNTDTTAKARQWI